MLYIDNPTQVGFSYSEPVNGYVDPSSGSIITLPDAICPDYAEAFGTCGTYSYANESLTSNSTIGMCNFILTRSFCLTIFLISALLDAAPKFWKTLQGFMGAFPQYSRKGFTFSTESYGGQ